MYESFVHKGCRIASPMLFMASAILSAGATILFAVGAILEAAAESPPVGLDALSSSFRSALQLGWRLARVLGGYRNLKYPVVGIFSAFSEICQLETPTEACLARRPPPAAAAGAPQSPCFPRANSSSALVMLSAKACKGYAALKTLLLSATLAWC